jgi:hypothetical protein
MSSMSSVIVAHSTGGITVLTRAYSSSREGTGEGAGRSARADPAVPTPGEASVLGMVVMATSKAYALSEHRCNAETEHIYSRPAVKPPS